MVVANKTCEAPQMCVAFIDINDTHLIDCYPLLCIDHLVDVIMGFSLMSFLDTYSSYQQIWIDLKDEKNDFITEEGMFYYKRIFFGLKNVGITYQR